MKYSITFENWDDDALEAGETDDKGYEVQDVEMDHPLDFPSEFKGANASEYPLRSISCWFTITDTDFRTGNTENKSIHFHDITMEDIKKIYSFITGR
jgi:hypothetical protein